MQTCPRCLNEYPRKHFVYKNDIMPVCRACRVRAVDKARARKRRGLKQEESGLLVRILRARTLHKGVVTSREKKRLKSRFLTATSVTRTRIRIMEKKVLAGGDGEDGVVKRGSVKTTRALAIRKELLTRFEIAYARQLEMLDSGVTPPDINDMI